LYDNFRFGLNIGYVFNKEQILCDMEYAMTLIWLAFVLVKEW